MLGGKSFEAAVTRAGTEGEAGQVGAPVVTGEVKAGLLPEPQRQLSCRPGRSCRNGLKSRHAATAGGGQTGRGAPAMGAAGSRGADRGQQAAGQRQNRAEDQEQDQEASGDGSLHRKYFIQVGWEKSRVHNSCNAGHMGNINICRRRLWPAPTQAGSLR